MKHVTELMQRVTWLRLVPALILAMSAVAAPEASAQVPARFYWKTLDDGNAVPLIVNSITGNTNPFDPAHVVVPGASFDATLALTGYAHTFSVFDRSSMSCVPPIPVCGSTRSMAGWRTRTSRSSSTAVWTRRFG